MDPLQNILTTLQSLVTAVNNLNQTVLAVFPQGTGTTTSATAGGASALPATPAGYLSITLADGTAAKVPYYAV